MRRVDLEPLDQRPGLGVAFGIEHMIGVAAAPQKICQPDRVAAFALSQDDRAAGAGLQQSDTTQDQRAHDPLAEFRLGDQLGRADARAE